MLIDCALLTAHATAIGISVQEHMECRLKPKKSTSPLYLFGVDCTSPGPHWCGRGVGIVCKILLGR